MAFVLLVLMLMFRPTGILGESLGKGAGMSNHVVQTHARQGLAPATGSAAGGTPCPGRAQWAFGVPVSC